MRESTVPMYPYRKMYTPLTADEAEAIKLYAHDQVRATKHQLREIVREALIQKGYLTREGRAVAWIQEQAKEQSHEQTT